MIDKVENRYCVTGRMLIADARALLEAGRGLLLAESGKEVLLDLASVEEADSSALGMIAGIWADKFDQLAAFQNFLIMPLTMLSGVFYSIHSLPPFWQQVSHFNPVFYMIDGFRYGFFGVSDVSPAVSLGITSASFLVVGLATLALLRKGYKLRY